MAQLFHAGPSPHIRVKETTQTLMRDVIIALVPAVIAGIYFYGWRAAVVLAVSVATCIVSEFVYNKVMKQKVTVTNLSCVVTGLLLGLSCSPLTPWWTVMIGASFAIIIVKMLFGGLGHNFMNPALAGRALMMASWPRLMTTFMSPHGEPDLITSATPLAAGQTGSEVSDYLGWFLGDKAGSIGEISILALLIGLVYLLARGVITAEATVSYLASFAFFAWMWGGLPSGSLFTGNPLYEILNGGVMLAAVFMVTDYTTTPMTTRGRIVFGIGAGFLTMAIRSFGSYPEGVTYSILIMNLAVPLIDKALIPVSFGGGGKKEKERETAEGGKV